MPLIMELGEHLYHMAENTQPTAEELRERAMRRRQRVLAGQRGRMEAVGGNADDLQRQQEKDERMFATTGAPYAPSAAPNAHSSLPSLIRIKTFIRALTMLLLLPLAFFAALQAVTAQRECWPLDADSDLPNSLLSWLGKTGLSKTGLSSRSGMFMFAMLEFTSQAMLHLPGALGRKDSGPNMLAAIAASLNLPRPVQMLAQKATALYTIYQSTMTILRDLALYLVAFQFLQLAINSIF